MKLGLEEPRAIQVHPYKGWLFNIVAISVRIDIFSRIELFPSNVLSSEKTNCKNDIQ